MFLHAVYLIRTLSCNRHADCGMLKNVNTYIHTYIQRSATQTVSGPMADPDGRRTHRHSGPAHYRRGSRGEGWVRRPPLGRRDPRRSRGSLRLNGRKKGHWCPLNGCSTPFKHNIAIKCKHLEKLQICVCVCQKSLIPISYKVIIPLAPSPGRNTGSAPALRLSVDLSQGGMLTRGSESRRGVGGTPLSPQSPIPPAPPNLPPASTQPHPQPPASTQPPAPTPGLFSVHSHNPRPLPAPSLYPGPLLSPQPQPPASTQPPATTPRLYSAPSLYPGPLLSPQPLPPASTQLPTSAPPPTHTHHHSSAVIIGDHLPVSSSREAELPMLPNGRSSIHSI